MSAYDELLSPEFRGVGTVGFVLNRDQWAARHSRGLVNQELRVDDRELRLFGDTAVVSAVETQRTLVRGQENNGSFRIPLVATREDERWRIVHVQFSGR